jgi:hypothetical protein
MDKPKATKLNPNAEGHCDKCPDKPRCPLHQEGSRARDVPVLRK